MIRVVLAVALAFALVAVAAPAIDHAAAVRTDERVASDVSSLDRAATSLVASEELPPPNEPGPRRIVTVSLPADSPTTAPVDYVAVGATGSTLEDASPPSPREASVVAYRLEGGPERVTSVDAPLRTADGDPLVLRGTGDRTLVLSLERAEGGEPVVVVSRSDGTDRSR